MKLTVAYFYPEELNLYGDRGNVEMLLYRAKARDIECELLHIDTSTKLNSTIMQSVNLVMMGGGPDSGQRSMYKDFISEKGNYLKEYIENDGYGIYICGSYQLLGNYYKDQTGFELEGLGAFDLYTEHFGKHKPRCVGNVVAKLASGEFVTGFENHGGRTYLSSELVPFAKIIKGYGNNGSDLTEGVIYKNSIGTYLHGPLFAKNPFIADHLISGSLSLPPLQGLPIDALAKSAQNKALKYK